MDAWVLEDGSPRYVDSDGDPLQPYDPEQEAALVKAKSKEEEIRECQSKMKAVKMTMKSMIKAASIGSACLLALLRGTSARATEQSVMAVWLRDGGGTDRSRVSARVAVRAVVRTSGRPTSAPSGACGEARRGAVRERRRSGRDRDLSGWCTSCIPVNRLVDHLSNVPQVHYPDGVVGG